MESARYELKKAYEKPSITTYTEEDISAMIGPAQTCSSGFDDDGPGRGWGRGGRGHGYGRPW